MREIADLSDEELMKAYQLGEDGAFAILYKRHSSKIFGFLKKRLIQQDLTEDIFQAVFLKLHKTRATYNATLPFLPWLFSLVRSVMVDGIRSSHRVQEIAYSVLPEKGNALEKGEPAAIPDLSRLPERQQKALELRYREDLSFDEIARQLNTSPANARQLISRGIKNLKGYRGEL